LLYSENYDSVTITILHYFIHR